MSTPINIAIDGPVASGKGTVTKALAARLGIPALDTGAMYRGVTVYLLDHQVNLADEKAVLLMLNKVDLQIYMTDNLLRVFVGGRDVTARLRDNQVSINTARVAAYPGVRDYVNRRIATVASQGNYILEGRDIGTVVLPNANYKFFLTASLEERARRRQIDLRNKGEEVAYLEVMAQIKQRDQADMNRAVGPLKQATDAILIDNTGLNLEQTVDAMVAHLPPHLIKKI